MKIYCGIDEVISSDVELAHKSIIQGLHKVSVIQRKKKERGLSNMFLYVIYCMF